MRPPFTLYAYVDGSDLDELAVEMESRFEQFVQSGEWRCERIWVVNRHHADDPSLGSGDLPDWDLGLNLELPGAGSESAEWFADVERIAVFLGQLHTLAGRDFVIGMGDSESGVAEDLFYVDSEEPDIDRLRAILGFRRTGDAS